MTTFTGTLNGIRRSLSVKIDELIDDIGEESKHSNEEVLNVEDICGEDLCYNLDGSRYLTEISRDRLIDNEGNEYDYDVLTIEQRAKIVDTAIAYTKSDAYKINEAEVAFGQWCDDDARAEVKKYGKKTGKSVDFDQVGTDDFYIWLYDQGIRK